MNSSLLLFIFMVLISPIISLSSVDWVISWLGMEVGMFGLIPLLLFKSSSKESAMKYFLIQSLSSALMLISGIFLFEILFSIEFYNLLFLLSMSIKLGFFPGHFWVISIIENLSVLSNTFVLGPLKIAPFGFLSLVISNNNNMLMILGLFSVIVGAMLGFNQTNIRAMLGASSISHSGWIIMSLCFGFMWYYLMSYILILMITFISMKNFEFFTSLICIISLSGLPPFLMFILKMKVLYFLLLSLEYLILFILIVSSVISLYYYLKFFYSIYLNQKKFSSTLMFIIFSLLNFLGISLVVCLFFESWMAMNF
uniref:NADH-ubiquinone oxidoreductase chain 2 n=1 Tax=Planorbis carinatus TaxID=446412 RepID=A0A7D6W8H5_9GAST|nr:NADH dehydrogenase subunit 2 [Planorbis carinatus]